MYRVKYYFECGGDEGNGPETTPATAGVQATQLDSLRASPLTSFLRVEPVVSVYSDRPTMTHILLPAHNASAWTGPTGNNTYLLPGRVPTLIDARRRER